MFHNKHLLASNFSPRINMILNKRGFLKKFLISLWCKEGPWMCLIRQQQRARNEQSWLCRCLEIILRYNWSRGACCCWCFKCLAHPRHALSTIKCSITHSLHHTQHKIHTRAIIAGIINSGLSIWEIIECCSYNLSKWQSLEARSYALHPPQIWVPWETAQHQTEKAPAGMNLNVVLIG